MTHLSIVLSFQEQYKMIYEAVSEHIDTTGIYGNT